MNSAEVVQEIAQAISSIKTFRFFSFSSATKLQDRLFEVSAEELKFIKSAIEKKNAEKSRFWNSLFSIFIENKRHSRELLSEAFFHQANRDYVYVESEDLRKFLVTPFSATTAINSKVLMRNGSTRHIPLLDFKIPSGDGHDALVVDSVKTLGLSGYLLESGKSYHFIGTSLISESDLLDLLAKFIFLDPISDKAWAAHQILERSASLRISQRNGQPPTVITRV